MAMTDYESQLKRAAQMAHQQRFSALAGQTIGGISANAVQKSETPFTRLSSAVERLRSAEAHMSAVCSKLCGDVPSADAGAATRPTGSSGMFGVLEDMAELVARLADDIETHAGRIERHL